MSRIGKLPITIPEKVTVNVSKSEIEVKGPKGTLTVPMRDEINVKIDGNECIVTRKAEDKASRSFHGLYRMLINNMVTGVSVGYKKVLIISGVGYRAEVKGNILHLNLGFSNPIEYYITPDVKITAETQTKLIIEGIDKQRVGQVAAEIRSLRAPEPYKGKGIKYETETIKRKVGKSGVKK